MTSMRVRAVIIAVAVFVLLQGCADSRARQATQQYVSTTESLIPLGELYLGHTRLRFGALEGEMALRYVGVMPDSAGEDLAGASVYRIENGQAYFDRNVGKHAFCAQAPRWVAVNSPTGAPAWSAEIWVGLLTLEDWERFSPGVDAACLAGDYIRAVP